MESLSKLNKYIQHTDEHIRNAEEAHFSGDTKGIPMCNILPQYLFYQNYKKNHISFNNL